MLLNYYSLFQQNRLLTVLSCGYRLRIPRYRIIMHISSTVTAQWKGKLDLLLEAAMECQISPHLTDPK